jgi:predicted metalloprotease
MRVKLFSIALFLSLFLAACGGSTVGGSQEGQAAPAQPSPPTQTATTTNTGCPGGSLEGCFSYSQMAAYLEAVKPMVAQFFQTSYPRISAPRDIVYVPAGRAAAGPCGYSTSAAYEYCAANRKIYIGQDLLWAFYRQHGDAAPVIGLAHEWAHHLQFMLDVPAARTAAESVRFENQADCLSGAFARYAGEQGWLEYPDDLEDVDGLLQTIGSRETASRDHGTAAERARAFDMGFESGATACNSFFPNSPVA